MNAYLDIILRTSAIYLFIIVAFRISGKKELSQLTVIDLVFIMLISNSVQNAMVGNSTSLLGGLAAAVCLFVLNYILKQLFFKNQAFSKLVQGVPVMLVYGGRLLEKHLEREKISHDELLAAAREHGVSSLENIDLAVLETDGSISILSKDYAHKTRKHRPAKNLIPGNQ